MYNAGLTLNPTLTDKMNRAEHAFFFLFVFVGPKNKTMENLNFTSMHEGKIANLYTY